MASVATEQGDSGKQPPSSQRGTKIVTKVRLSNPGLIYIFGRVFAQTDTRLYYIVLVAPSVLKAAYPTKLRREIETHLDQQFADVDKMIDYANKLLDDNDLSAGEAAGCEELDVEFRTPLSKKYIDLFVRCDDAMRLIDTAWLNGVLTDTKRGELERSIRRHVHSMMNKINNVNGQIVRIAKERKSNPAGEGEGTIDADDAPEGSSEAPPLKVIKAA